MKIQALLFTLAGSIILTGCGSNELNFVGSTDKDQKSTIHISDGKGTLTWEIPGEKEPTVIQIESVEALYPELLGKILSKNDYKIRITGYGSVMSLSRVPGGYFCFECASIRKNLIQVTPPVLWKRTSK